MITLHDETVPVDEFKTEGYHNYYIRELQVPIFKNGKLVYQVPTIEETRKKCQKELETLYPEIKRINNPRKYNVVLSKKLLALKEQLLLKYKEQIIEEDTKNKQKVLGVR